MKNMQTQSAMQAINIYRSAIKYKKEIHVSESTGNLRIKTFLDYVKSSLESLVRNTPLVDMRASAKESIILKLEAEIKIINKNFNENKNNSTQSVIDKIFSSIQENPSEEIHSILSSEIKKLTNNDEAEIKGYLKLFSQIENEIKNTGQIEENFLQNELKTNGGDLSEALAINNLAIRLRGSGKVSKENLIDVARQINFAMNKLRLPYKKAFELQNYANTLQRDNKFPKEWSAIEIMDAAQAVRSIIERGIYDEKASIFLTIKRKNGLSKINEMLPKGMLLEYVSEGIEITKRFDFSPDETKKFNDEIKALQKYGIHKGTSDNPEYKGLEEQFITDFLRNNFVFLNENGKIIKGDSKNLKPDEFIKNFRDFCEPAKIPGKDSKAAQTISRYLSQTIMGSLLKGSARTVENKNGFRLLSLGQAKTGRLEFIIQRINKEKIKIIGSTFFNGELLGHTRLDEDPPVNEIDENKFKFLNIIPPAGEGRVATASKFSTKISFSIEVSQADMDSGVLKQEFCDQPSVTNRFVLDWRVFDQEVVESEIARQGAEQIKSAVD